MNDLSGVILAGGLSRRMGGQDKTLLKLNGTPLVQHVKDRLEKQVGTVLLNANGDPARFSFLGVDVFADTIPGFAGPLAGILSGLRWAQGKSEWIITAAADTPFFPENYSAALMEQADNNKIVLASSNNQRHPVFGMWHVSLANPLEKFLLADERKVMLFVQQYSHAMVEFEATTYDPFFNVNTPEDLEKAETIAGEIGD